MSRDESERCAQRSRDAGEPMAGTAVAGVRRWLLIEQRHAWGRDVRSDPPFEGALGDWLDALHVSVPGLRVQWIRHPEQHVAEGRPARLFVVRTDVGQESVWTTTFEQVGDFPTLQLERALGEGVPPSEYEVFDGPLVAVCAHGRRDACCALRGVPLYEALRKRLGDVVWQTSHTGGHRFAPTGIVFPDGLCYGRLDEVNLDDWVAGLRDRELAFPSALRGRCGLSAAAQAAEVEWRRVDGVRAPLNGVQEHEEGGHLRIALSTCDEEAEFLVTSEARGTAVPLSCGSPKQRVPVHFTVHPLRSTGQRSEPAPREFPRPES